MARFNVGDVVHHKADGKRGVVVSPSGRGTGAEGKVEVKFGRLPADRIEVGEEEIFKEKEWDAFIENFGIRAGNE
jgi:hypothetical protein